MKNDNLKGQHRINEQIRAKEVRIVGDEIESKVYPIAQALRLAEEHNADLVEISPNAQPPVCRIIDYSKFLYQLKKRQKEQKAKQVKVNVKEIRFGPQTDDHDYNFKLKHAKSFLEDGDKVKAYVFFKGRSILFKEQGEVLLLRFANDLEDYAKVDQMPVLEGKRMTIQLSPKKGVAKKWRRMLRRRKQRKLPEEGRKKQQKETKMSNAIGIVRCHCLLIIKTIIEMPKVKTNSGAKKRFALTGTGKIKRKHAYHSHILTKKTKKQKKNLCSMTLVDKSNVRAVKALLTI